jgi:hypothetical protein
MGGSVGKIIGAAAGFALAPFTGGASLALAGLGALAGETLIDAPKRVEQAQEQAQQRAEQAKADALAAASAKRSEMAEGTGLVARKGASTIGEQDKKDTRATVRKKKQGAGKLRIDPLASTGAAGGAATSGETGLNI